MTCLLFFPHLPFSHIYYLLSKVPSKMTDKDFTVVR